jgi:hypothetical protein
MEHSPAEHVRRPAVPAESSTLGFTCLQFEAVLTASRQSGLREVKGVAGAGRGFFLPPYLGGLL